MKTFSVPPDTSLLLAIADSVTWALEDKHTELGIDCDDDVQLSACRAAAEHCINRYFALAAEGEKSPQARLFLNAARVRCDRSVEQLRRRITRALDHLCRIMTDEELCTVVRHVIAVGA